MKQKNADDIMYDWETKKEYDYRMKTQKIIGSAKTLLNTIATANKNDKILTMNNGFNEIVEYVKVIHVPSLYYNVNKFLLKAMESYKISFDLLKESEKKDTEKIVMSGVYIREGNAYMELSRIDIYKMVSNKQKESSGENNVKIR